MAGSLSASDHGHGGTASKWPVDAAGSAAAMDGPSKSPAGAGRPQPLGRRRTDAGAHSPLENRPTDAGFPHRQQAPHVTIDLLGREDLG